MIWAHARDANAPHELCLCLCLCRQMGARCFCPAAVRPVNQIGVKLSFSGFKTRFAPSNKGDARKTHLKSRFCAI